MGSSASNNFQENNKYAQKIGQGGGACAYFPFYDDKNQLNTKKQEKHPYVLLISSQSNAENQIAATKLVRSLWKWVLNIEDFYSLVVDEKMLMPSEYSSHYVKECWNWVDPTQYTRHRGILLPYAGRSLESMMHNTRTKTSRLQAAIVLYRWIALVILTFELGLAHDDPTMRNIVVDGLNDLFANSKLVFVRYIDLGFNKLDPLIPIEKIMPFDSLESWAERFDIDNQKTKHETLLSLLQSKNILGSLSWLKDYLVRHRQSKQLIQNISLTRV